METKQVYLHAHVALKEGALAGVPAMKGLPYGRYRPPDRLLHFLSA
jgi:integrase/recombinase XerD